MRALLEVERDVPELPKEQLDRMAARIGAATAPPASVPPEPAPKASPGAPGVSGSHLAASLLGVALGVAGTLFVQALAANEASSPPPAFSVSVDAGQGPTEVASNIDTDASVHPGPAVEPAHEEVIVEAEAEPDRTRRRVRIPSRPTPEDRLSEERRLVDAARGALAADDPEGALAIVARHQANFSNGVMVEEREVRALLALGRASEARARTDNFRRDFPQSLAWSALSARLRRAGEPQGEGEESPEGP